MLSNIEERLNLWKSSEVRMVGHWPHVTSTSSNADIVLASIHGTLSSRLTCSTGNRQVVHDPNQSQFVQECSRSPAMTGDCDKEMKCVHVERFEACVGC